MGIPHAAITNDLLPNFTLQSMKRTLIKLSFFALVVLTMGSCESNHKKQRIVKIVFGTTQEGEQVDLYELKNAQGVEMKVITYGGRITSLKVPDTHGTIEDVVLGFDHLADYERANPYFGALIGRYGNRIADATFDLEGVSYPLAANNGKNHLHGGVKGFDRVVWNAEAVQTQEGPSVVLSYLSKDMEEGYPGNLKVKIAYVLTHQNELIVSYTATTDKKTVLNLTQHSYFNLTGDFSTPILDHQVVLNADYYTPVDDTLIPTGEIAPVSGTPFDFTKSKAIGLEINNDNEQLLRGKGYDHNWVLNDQNSGVRWAAKVVEPNSGRVMEVFTDEPGVQFYTGNFLDGTLPSKQGGVYAHRTGFCLETQHYPNSPNQPNFPTTELLPGETYQTHTTFKFSVVP